MSIKLKILYAVMLVLVAYTLWPSSDDEAQKSGAIHVWDAHVDAQGNLNVLGVVLGVSTLKQAETKLVSQSERALFIPADSAGETKKPTIEAFFPTSPDRAKLIIEVAADDALIDTVKSRAYKPFVFPSGSVKLEIAPEHNELINQAVVKTLTYIPPVTLKREMVEQHFGPPQKNITDADGNSHLMYPALGLDIVIPKEGKALLQFVPPSEFGRLLDLLGEHKPKEVV